MFATARRVLRAGLLYRPSHSPSRGGHVAVRVILAAILISAAALKGYQLATGPVLGTGLFSSRILLIAVVEFEWLLGIWLITGLFPKWAWRVALGCFAVFASVSLYKGLSGDASCGCFGQVEVSPWWTLALDLGAVVALHLWPPRGRVPEGGIPQAGFAPRPQLFPLSILLFVAMLAGVSGAAAMASFRPAMLAENGMIVGPGNVVVLDPEEWVGKRFPLLDYIDIGHQLAHGQWIVLLYHYNCPKCQEVLPQYVAIAARLRDTSEKCRVALVELSPYDARSARLLYHHRCPSCQEAIRGTISLQVRSVPSLVLRELP